MRRTAPVLGAVSTDRPPQILTITHAAEPRTWTTLQRPTSRVAGPDTGSFTSWVPLLRCSEPLRRRHRPPPLCRAARGRNLLHAEGVVSDVFQRPSSQW